MKHKKMVQIHRNKIKTDIYNSQCQQLDIYEQTDILLT